MNIPAAHRAQKPLSKHLQDQFERIKKFIDGKEWFEQDDVILLNRPYWVLSKLTEAGLIEKELFTINGFHSFKYRVICKSPKDQPEQTEGESHHPYAVVTIENAISELKSCYKRLGYENSNVLMALEDLHKHLNQNS
jgi:hypothetical protein